MPGAALVTGADGPLGAAIARALLAQGAHVAAVGDAEPAFPGLDRGAARRCLAFATDIASGEAVAALIAEVTATWTVARLFNAAELAPPAAAATDLGAWDRAFATNARAPFVLCTALIPHLARNGGGAIVTVAPPVAPASAPGRAPAYWASKAAVIGLTRALAERHAGDGIRVNCLAPPVLERPARVALAALRLAADDRLTGAVVPLAPAVSRRAR